MQTICIIILELILIFVNNIIKFENLIKKEATHV